MAVAFEEVMHPAPWSLTFLRESIALPAKGDGSFPFLFFSLLVARCYVFQICHEWWFIVIRVVIYELQASILCSLSGPPGFSIVATTYWSPF